MAMYEKDVLSAFEVLVDMIETRARLSPGRLAYCFRCDEELQDRIETCTCEQLHQRAAALAVVLQSRDLSGRPLMTMHPVGLDYVIVFFGCLYAGAIPVPVYPPERCLKRCLPRLRRILENCEAAAILTTGSLMHSLPGQLDNNKAGEPVEWLAPDNVGSELAGLWKKPFNSRSTIALLE